MINFVTNFDTYSRPAMVDMISRSMKPTRDLLSSVDNSWKQFSNAWKKAHSKASEKSVHDLRVSTRRLIATLELLHVLSRRDDIRRLQKRVKKVLKRIII